MKKIIQLIGILVLILVVLVLARNFIVKTTLQRGVSALTGLHLDMGKLDIGILKSSIDIQNLRFYNPKGYHDKTMFDMPEIYIEYDLPDILKKKIHLPEVRINLKELIVVRNEAGDLNLQALKALKDLKRSTPESNPKAKKPKEIQIDTLELKIGRVIYKDYSQGGSPAVREYNININERYQNITKPNTLVRLIVVRALAKTTISSLVGLDLSQIKGTLGGTLRSAQKVSGALTGVTGQALKETQAIAEDAAKKTTEALKDITDSIKLPFE